MSCQALIPPAAITMITIARVAGLIEKPIVRGTAAISPFGPSTAVSFVLIPIHIGAGVARYLAGIVTFAREIFVTLSSAVVTGAFGCPSPSGTAAPVADMQRPRTAHEQRTDKEKYRIIFHKNPGSGTLLVPDYDEFCGRVPARTHYRLTRR